MRQFVILATAMLVAYPAQRGLAQPANGNPNPNPTDVVITTAEVTYTANQPNLITINGAFFGATKGTVILGDQFLTPISWTNTQVVADLPSNTPARSYLLVVIRAGSPPHGAYLDITMGVTGPQGPVGPIGPIGPQGLVGPQGPQGVTGTVGSQGPQGQQGTTGPLGPIGATGSAGPVGPLGPIGPQGPQGPLGPQGPVGLSGHQIVSSACQFATVKDNDILPCSVSCPAGKSVLGGGITTTGDDSILVTNSGPNGTTGWTVSGRKSNGVGSNITVTAYATCATVAP